MTFYILAIERSHRANLYWWWRPNRRGYTTNLNQAGKYTDVSHLNSDEDIAIPCELVERQAVLVVPVSGRVIEGWRVAGEREVVSQ